MRVSQHYALGMTQPQLEFLDVDITNDVSAFVDPHALRYVHSDWARECVSLIQDFFSEVLEGIRQGREGRVQRLLEQLSEPNETHLGLSVGRSKGSGVGHQLARDIWDALRSSAAVSSGLLADVEDAILFVEGIGFDRVSDMTTNIIRRQLIVFTQDVCQYYGIPMVTGVGSGPMWNRRTRAWEQGFTKLPVAAGSKLVLVPKSIVRRSGIFDPGEYYNHHVLPYLQHEEMDAGGPLVQRRKNGAPFVTKKSLRERDSGPSKKVNLETTLRDPTILDSYRSAKTNPSSPLSHGDIAAITETPDVDWDALLAAVTAVPAGKAGADDYHRAVQALLTALLYPALDFPKREHKIHEGRKRIDINYTNVAAGGFFRWLIDIQQVPAAQIPVECKNYGKDLENPEFDQLAGRFSPARGKVGLLVYRGYGDKPTVVQRCRDAALDHRGYVIALDDEDLAALVDERKAGKDNFERLLRRFQELT